MKIAALVLAAGLSRRMAPRNKLLMTDGTGLAMVARVVRSALASRAAEVIVVTGHQAEAIAESLHGLAGRAPLLVHAKDYAQGMSASLIAGIAALPESVDGALICLADMPLVTHSLLDRLIEAFEGASQPAIVVPLCGGQRGNPILWHRRFWPAFSELSGDRGARAYLDTYARHVTAVETGDDSVLRDFDTPGAMG